MLKIKEAIAFQNAYRNRKGSEKMTGQKLSAILFPKLSTAHGKLSRIIHGKESASPEDVKTICNECEVDPNFLFGYDAKTKSFDSNKK